MAKISKNIKQFRNAAGITQDDLAAKINVSRQTISSWETDRTQPDVDMLEALASVFEVSIEEIIYGRKNRIGLEAEPKKDRNIFVIVLSVIGSLMTAAGLVIVFAYFWDKLENFKLIFAFLPLIAGFAVAMYAVTKKKDSIPWMEGSAVAWTVGLIVTNALADTIIDADFGFFTLLLIDVLVTVPIVLITKGMIPFLFCLYGASHSIIGFYNEGDIDSILIMAALLTAAIALGVVFCAKYRCSDIRKKVMGHAVAVTAMTDLTVVICFLTDKLSSTCSEFFVVLILLSGFALFAFNAYEKVPVFAPEVKSGIYSAIIALVSVIMILDNEPYCEEWYVYLIPMGLAVALTVGSYILNFKNNKYDILRTGTAVLALAIDVLLLICMKYENEIMALTYISLLVGLAMALFIIAKGIRTSDLFTANVGMIMACVIIWIVIIFSGFNLLAKGISCSVTGIILLLADKKLVASIKKEEVAADD